MVNDTNNYWHAAPDQGKQLDEPWISGFNLYRMNDITAKQELKMAQYGMSLGALKVIWVAFIQTFHPAFSIKASQGRDTHRQCQGQQHAKIPVIGLRFSTKWDSQ